MKAGGTLEIPQHICIISVSCEIKGGPVAVHLSAQPGGLKTHPSALYCTLIKKENQIFLQYQEIHNRAVAKSNMSKSFLIYEEMRKYLTIYEEAVSHI